MLGETKKQFSFTRAHLRTNGRAKSNFLSVESDSSDYSGANFVVSVDIRLCESVCLREAFVLSVHQRKLSILLLLVLYLSAFRLIAVETNLTEITESRRWSSFLPLMAEEAIKRGYELPLPFGVSAIYNHIERDIQVNDLRLGLNGAPPRSVSRFVDLGSNSRVDAGIGRIDAWLLPFVNVYALGGCLRNESVTEGIATFPQPGPPGSRTLNFTAKTVLEGFVAGAGLTLAAGYRNFFVTADANYSRTDIGFDETFRALIVSSRVGWNGRIGVVPTRFWVGVMYWDTENIAKGTVNIPGEGSVKFEVDQGPAHPWNASVGTSVVISRHWETFLEYGFNFNDVKFLATGLTFRF